VIRYAATPASFGCCACIGRERLLLSGSPIAALENGKADKEAHDEFDTPSGRFLSRLSPHTALGG
jgi:hypothetical protein